MCNHVTTVSLHALSPRARRGFLRLGPLLFPCALGRSGRRWRKHEGDGATPCGRWPLRRVLYRADRVRRPHTALPIAPLYPKNGWCDDPANGQYNRPVRLPFRAGCEHLWRADHLYDIIIVLGHNERPRVRGLGSAVFVHVAAPDWGATEGCVALREADLRRLLGVVGRRGAVLDLRG